MRAAIALYGNRVSPRFDFSEQLLVAEVVNGGVRKREVLSTRRLTVPERLEQLSALDIDLFVCGAADPEFLSSAGVLDIRVIPDVAGDVSDVLEELSSGRLLPGHGTYADDNDPTRRRTIDCISCLDRPCLTGRSCPGLVPEIHSVPEGLGHRPIMDVATDIAWETERRLCRVAELVYFCHGMDYSHVGVAFCVELYRETQILTHLLRRFFRVTPVCCKLGGKIVSEEDTVSQIICNPIAQAAELNRVRTNINVIAGLCIGCDVLFTRHSSAPVTTLFVKDRLLAHNPVGALYSKHYIDDLVGQTPWRLSLPGGTSIQGVES